MNTFPTFTEHDLAPRAQRAKPLKRRARKTPAQKRAEREAQRAKLDMFGSDPRFAGERVADDEEQRELRQLIVYAMQGHLPRFERGECVRPFVPPELPEDDGADDGELEELMGCAPPGGW